MRARGLVLATDLDGTFAHGDEPDVLIADVGTSVADRYWSIPTHHDMDRALEQAPSPRGQRLNRPV